MTQTTKRNVVLIGAVGLLVTLGGCMESLTEVVVNKDGSGFIYQKMLMSPMVAQMAAGFGEGLGGPGGDEPEGPPELGGAPGQGGGAPGANPLLDTDEEKLKAQAADFGEGVRFVSVTEKKNEKGWQGYLVKYKFDDVTKLKISTDSKPAGLPDGPPGAVVEEQEEVEAADEKEFITFAFTAGDEAELTIIMPKSDIKKDLGPLAGGGQPKDPKQGQPVQPGEVPQQPEMDPAMMKMMFDGMRMMVRVRVEGEVTESNATHLEKEESRASLMEVDFGELLGNVDGFKKLAEVGKIENEEEAKKLVSKLPGFKIELEPEVTIKFQ